MKKLLVALAFSAFTFGYSQSEYYNDYRSSINAIDWQSVVSSLLLSNSQRSQLMSLNNQYPDYNSWNAVYGNNPTRWSRDRYTQVQRIMGNDKYQKFKNKYYKGQNPVAVYNRNKNSDKRYKHLNKKAVKYNDGRPAKIKEYEKRKNAGDPSHMWIKGNGKGKKGK